MIARLIAVAFFSLALVAGRADDAVSVSDLSGAPAARTDAASTERSANAPDEWTVRPPPGWSFKQDATSKVIFMRPPDALVTKTSSDVEIVILPARDFDGTAEEWHEAMIKFVLRGGRLLEPASKRTIGPFLVSNLHLSDATNTEQRQVVYTARWGKRAQAFVFVATREAVFKKNQSTAERAITAAFAPKTEAAETATDAPMPAELTIETPPGWSRQHDAKSHAEYMVPPGARTLDDAGLIAFPSVAFAGTAEQFHQQTFATLINGARPLEPVAHALAGAFEISAAHCVTAKGAELRLILYTARWGQRAQAFLFAAARADLFTRESPAANRAVVAVAVPGAATTAKNQSPTNPGADAALAMATPPSDALANPAQRSDYNAETGDTMPVLNYTDPPNFFRGGGKTFAEYQGSDINFTLCVYPFREVQGDPAAAFEQTLLRDWIDVMFREEGVADRPQISANKMPGADRVIEAHFLDPRQQQHHRILVVSGHWAAIVDMIAPTPFAWQKGYASAAAMLQTLSVSRQAAPPALANGPGPEGAKLAGLFQGIKGKTVSNLMLGPGYLSTKTALHFYLFSADGRVYRCYDFPPGGSEAAARQFDFDGAERQDPTNSGRFAVRGNQLYLKMGGAAADEITTVIAELNTLQLDGVTYTRKF